MEVQKTDEILGRAPAWIIRWGMGVIFLLIVCLAAAAWVIQYPDVIKGEILLTTINQPIRVYAKNSGTITRLYAREGDVVRTDDSLAIIQSTLSLDAVKYLRSTLDSINLLMYDKLEYFLLKETDRNFGEIQLSFNELRDFIYQYQRLRIDNYTADKINITRVKIRKYKQLSSVLDSEAKFLKTELDNAKTEFSINQKLFDTNVISKVDFMKNESLLMQKQLEYERLRREVITNLITIDELESEIVDLEHESHLGTEAARNNISLKVSEIKNHINSWEQNYVIRAKNDGVLYQLQPLSVNKFVDVNTPLFAIAHQEKLKGFVTVSAAGAGKINIGQHVRIYLNNYPAHEYGKLMGRVVKISSVLNEKSYRVEVDLENGLITTYNKVLNYSPEMPGNVEIITNDISLIRRMFNSVTSLK